METVKRIAVRRIDGVYVDVWFQPVKSIRAAARFSTIEDYNTLMTGHYKPDNPDLYRPQTIQVTYEEVDDDVQTE